MQTVTSSFVSGKKVLVRYDLDVPIEDGKVLEDFRLKAGLETIRPCIQSASEVIILGHIGRPHGEDSSLSVAPIYQWFLDNGFKNELENKKLRLLENLRFERGEDEASLDYAKELASFGGVFINEAFAAHHKAASTTILPTLIPHAAGLNFAKEVEELTRVRDNPKEPLVAIIGGAKIDDKLPVVQVLAKKASKVLIGGKLPWEIKQLDINLPENVMVAKMNSEGTDLSDESLEEFKKALEGAKQIIWAGPMGRYEDLESRKGTEELAKAVVASGAETILGGGDSLTALKNYLSQFSFVSSGGGAMLKFLTDGTLPTIEALG